MPVSLDDARKLTTEFCRIYRGALRLAFKFRESTADLYGERAASVPKDMQGGYLSGELEHAGRVYLGRVDIPVGNIQDGHDFVLTLRHEVLGHYGANTFTPSEKKALLEAIIAARDEPSLRGCWRRIDEIYVGQAELVRAEEVFALVSESVTPRQGLNNVADEVGERAFAETCTAGGRMLRADDLAAIAGMVAQGLCDNTREQRNFPRRGEVLERLDVARLQCGATPRHSFVPQLLGPGLVGSLFSRDASVRRAEAAAPETCAGPAPRPR